MKCLIIEDEPLAIKVIEKHLSKLDGYEVMATFNTALPAYNYLQNHQIDLLFLDIEMPNLSGFNFLKTLQHHPNIIITTAHREYAIDSYDYCITDYLLKPISFERLLKAISKIGDTNPTTYSESIATTTPPSNNRDYVYIKVDRQNVKVYLEEILYVESVKNHVKIVLPHQSYLTLLNMQKIENKLDKEHFIRVHRSFIVALNKIQSFNNSSIQIGKQFIPIGRSYKLPVLDQLNRFLL